MASSCYKTTFSKDKAFKTAEIGRTAERCLELLRQDQTISIQERVTLVSSLETALKNYGTRVKKAIRRRWWHRIFAFFGYRAHSPKTIVLLRKKATQDRLAYTDLQEKNEHLLKIQNEIDASLRQFQNIDHKIHSFDDPEKLQYFLNETKAELRNIRDGLSYTHTNEISERISMLQDTIEKTAKTRIAQLETAAKVASGKKLDQIEARLQKIRAEFFGKLQEANRLGQRTPEKEQRRPGWIEPRQRLYTSSQNEITALIEELQKDPFYVGRFSNAPNARNIRARILLLVEDAYAAADEIRKIFYETPSYQSSFSYTLPSKTTLGLGKELRAHLLCLKDEKERIHNHQPLVKLAHQIERAVNENNIARIFDIENLPREVTQFESLHRKLSRITHPDKNLAHTTSAEFFQKAVNLASNRVRKKKYSST